MRTMTFAKGLAAGGFSAPGLGPDVAGRARRQHGHRDFGDLAARQVDTAHLGREFATTSLIPSIALRLWLLDRVDNLAFGVDLGGLAVRRVEPCPAVAGQVAGVVASRLERCRRDGRTSAGRGRGRCDGARLRSGRRLRDGCDRSRCDLRDTAIFDDRLRTRHHGGCAVADQFDACFERRNRRGPDGPVASDGQQPAGQRVLLDGSRCLRRRGGGLGLRAALGDGHGVLALGLCRHRLGAAVVDLAVDVRVGHGGVVLRRAHARRRHGRCRPLRRHRSGGRRGAHRRRRLGIRHHGEQGKGDEHRQVLQCFHEFLLRKLVFKKVLGAELRQP